MQDELCCINCGVLNIDKYSWAINCKAGWVSSPSSINGTNKGQAFAVIILFYLDSLAKSLLSLCALVGKKNTS